MKVIWYSGQITQSTMKGFLSGVLTQDETTLDLRVPFQIVFLPARQIKAGQPEGITGCIDHIRLTQIVKEYLDTTNNLWNYPNSHWEHTMEFAF